jgi:AraC-like DNA-binding protein
MASAFLRLEGNTVRNRLWNFLIVHSEFDYSMKDIAKFSDVSYTALKKIWKELIRRKIVIHTRNVGKARMYTLNRENPQVEKFITYYWSVVDLEVDKQLSKKEKALLPAMNA